MAKISKRRAARNAAIGVAMAAALAAGGAHYNEYEFHLAQVIDSDTYRGVAQIWPGQMLTIDVRLDGIDTPEKFRPDPRCRAHERALANRAAEIATNALNNASRIIIARPLLGKYAGRVVAQVWLVDSAGKRTAIADILMASGLAYEYHGGTKRSWCDVNRQSSSRNKARQRSPPLGKSDTGSRRRFETRIQKPLSPQSSARQSLTPASTSPLPLAFHSFPHHYTFHVIRDAGERRPGSANDRTQDRTRDQVYR